MRVPLCSFCEENYNLERKGGGEEHYILNSLREIISKSPSLAPCSPSLLGPSDSSPPLGSGKGELCCRWRGGFAGASLSCTSCFSSSPWGSVYPPSAAHKRTIRGFCLGKCGVIPFCSFSRWSRLSLSYLQLSTWSRFSSGLTVQLLHCFKLLLILYYVFKSIPSFGFLDFTESLQPFY